MSPARVEEVWKVIAHGHAWLAPPLRLEEEIAYLSVSGTPTGEREGLAQRRVTKRIIAGVLHSAGFVQSEGTILPSAIR